MHKTIGVFLSANADLPSAYREAAEQLGEWIGRTGRTLVFGGSNRGLMHVIAGAVKREGGRCVGVVPQVLFARGWNSPLLDETVATEDLTDRKVELIKRSDVIVALPGGLGTLDEVFTAIGHAAIGTDAKPVVLYNVEGCWRELIALLEGLHQRGLLRGAPSDYLRVADTFEELTRILGEA